MLPAWLASMTMVPRPVTVSLLPEMCRLRGAPRVDREHNRVPDAPPVAESETLNDVPL